MKKFAVGYVNLFDNILNIKIINAKDWKDALLNTFAIDLKVDQLEAAKEVAFDMDFLFDVKEVM